MTRLAVFSDTHGSTDYIQRTVDILPSLSVDLVLHLGDDYPDADVYAHKGYKLIRVPGTWGGEYQNPYIDNRRIDTVDGWRLFLTHTPDAHYNDRPDDLKPDAVIENKLCDLMLHGHTHKPELRFDNGIPILNPGHLKKGDTRGFPPTYGVLDIRSSSSLTVQVFRLHGRDIFLESTLQK